MNSHSASRTALLRKQENLQNKISLQLELLRSSILLLRSKKTIQPVPQRMWGHKTIKIANKYSPVPPPLVERQLPAVETPNTAHSPTKPNTDRRSITYLLRVISRLEQKHGHAPVASLLGSSDKVPSPVPQVFETLWDNALTFSQHLPEREPLHVPLLAFKPPPPFSRPRFPHRPPPTKFIPPPPRLPPLLPVFVAPPRANRGPSQSNKGPSGKRPDYVPVEEEYEDEEYEDEEYDGEEYEDEEYEDEEYEDEEYEDEEYEDVEYENEEFEDKDREYDIDVQLVIEEEPDRDEVLQPGDGEPDPDPGYSCGHNEVGDLGPDQGGDCDYGVEPAPDEDPDCNDWYEETDPGDDCGDGEDIDSGPALYGGSGVDWRDWGHSSIMELVTSPGWLEPDIDSCSWDDRGFVEDCWGE